MLNTFQSVKELMLGKNYDNILQQSSQGFLFTYDDWSDVVRMEKLQYIDNAQYAIIETLFSDFVNYLLKLRSPLKKRYHRTYALS